MISIFKSLKKRKKIQAGISFKRIVSGDRLEGEQQHATNMVQKPVYLQLKEKKKKKTRW